MQRALVVWSPGDLRLLGMAMARLVAAAMVTGVLTDLAVRSGGAVTDISRPRTGGADTTE